MCQETEIEWSGVEIEWNGKEWNGMEMEFREFLARTVLCAVL